MHDNEKDLPTVAIVGKPNVGKSSLFNSLLLKRKAIVSSEPGLTRDINYETVRFHDVRYRLADSAGFVRKKEDMYRSIQELNKRLIQEASLILFLCDIKGLSENDYEIAEKIRKSGKPFILVVNKVDNSKLFENLYGFYELGTEPLPISAIQRRNLRALQEEIVHRLVQSGGSAPSHALDTACQGMPEIGVALVGRPNVGKSSLLNLLVNSYRSLVAPEPGTTRDAVDETVVFNGSRIRFVDTAGIRKKRKVRENVEYYSVLRAERAIKNSTISVLLIDANQGITVQDKKIASIIVQAKKGLIIAANKWDIAKEQGLRTQELLENICSSFPHIAFAEILPISAKSGYNKIKLLKKILIVYNNYNRRVKTSELNDLLKEAQLYGLNVKYGFQKEMGPPVFEFFASGPLSNRDNSRRFLTNKIRKHFPFKGVPLEIKMRKK